MSIEPIRHEVRNLLAHIKREIRDEEQVLADDRGEASVEAAGRLVWLRTRKGELEARLAQLERSGEGAAPTLFEWIREDLMIVLQGLETWIEAR